MKKRKRRKPRQPGLPFGHNWGGRREGAGRKRKGRRLVPHRRRPPLPRRFPVHVTMRLRENLPSLRSQEAYDVLLGAFQSGRDRFGFRLIHYSVQSNHIHILAEARDRRSLWRGMQGLSVRVAKRLNRFWQRRGKVLADRYHSQILRTPTEVRNALRYVLLNARKHCGLLGLDRFSSSAWFDGWSGRGHSKPGAASPVLKARTWLLERGWKLHGLIAVSDAPDG